MIVDSPTHTVPIDLLNTKQEIIFEIDFIPFDFVQYITEYKPLFDMLKKYHLDSLVWEVVSGYPLTLNVLCVVTKRSDPEQQIYEVLQECIDRAEEDCRILLDMHANAASLFEHLQMNNSLPYEAGTPWMKSDVLVFCKQGCPSVFAPKTPTHAFVLSHQTERWVLSNCSLGELQDLCPSQTDKETTK